MTTIAIIVGGAVVGAIVGLAAVWRLAISTTASFPTRPPPGVAERHLWSWRRVDHNPEGAQTDVLGLPEDATLGYPTSDVLLDLATAPRISRNRHR